MPVSIELTDEVLARSARDRLASWLGPGASDGGAAVRVVPLDGLPTDPQEARMVAVGDVDLPSLVKLLRQRPWLDHVVSPKMLASESGGLVGAAFRKLLDGSSMKSGTAIDSEEIQIVDSEARNPHVDTICARAKGAGASPLAIERIRDVAEETIMNALYNAPAEADHKPRLRSERSTLEPHQACHVAHGVSGKLFLLRVRDGFGSFRRERLCQVLERCAAQAGVSLDTSRGGAGLGMWRVFSAATALVLEVEPGRATEITVAIDLQRRAPGARAVHLFFDGGGRA
jgi:hypothetical protein